MRFFALAGLAFGLSLAATTVPAVFASSPPDSTAPDFPEASTECEAVAESILDDWQTQIDEWADVWLDEFVELDRIYNVTDVPIGGDGCEPLTATTIATDRAGTLVAATPAQAVVRGIILADVGEMAGFGPGLDLDAPLLPAAPEAVDPTAAVEAIAAGEPPAGAPCEEWAEFAVTVVQALIDVAATTAPSDLAIGAGPYGENAPQIQALLGRANDGATASECDGTALIVDVLERWPELRARGLSANLLLGSFTDEFYSDLSQSLDQD